ncbi:NAD(P)/FAD-dependent oxidoreductase [Streptomyces sp. cmx-18-6]|uniref:NAD(P)/FAD-dependent oxidoreductase n=1 Tax=Streptomyces sp. cmx-18-6 TaxID=2790930 RepID=UPI003980CE1A
MSWFPATADVVVVGGGIIGLATAERLTDAGLTVAVVDESGIAGGATGVSGGLVRAFAPSGGDQDLAAAGLAVYRKRGWHGTWPAVRGRGSLTFLASGDLAQAHPAVTALREAGHKAEILTAEDVTTRFPGLRPAAGEYAVYEEEAGWLPAREVSAALVRDAGPLLRQVRARATGLLASGSRVTGVETSAGTIRARAVLLATGTGSTPLAATVGVRLPLRTRAVGYCLFRLGGGAVNTDLPVVVDRVAGSWLRPWDSASVVLAGVFSPRTDVPAEVRHGVPEQEVERVRDVLLRRIPHLAEAQPVGGVMAYDAMSPEGVGSVEARPEVAGLVTATGWNGGGFKLAPAVGERAAGLLREAMA